uniref:Uncharacterized protein n=1 Tax=Craspedostauros australis TaxID=1486917 RepID=A0A7R9WTI5_9STRA|mmetsp:Transcript_18776/g.52222  ORF Transcript_18776/g.52222 Transcript_18776/m.52222 type:complete len:123 (+) Transcript_18776:102-470(+)
MISLHSILCTIPREHSTNMQLNLLLSLVYNALAVPIAAGVFYPLVRTRLPPTVAALAMALSSVSVVLSSVSLKLYRPPRIAGTGTAVANTAGIPSPQRQDNDLTEPLLPSPAPEASPGIENV